MRLGVVTVCTKLSGKSMLDGSTKQSEQEPKFGQKPVSEDCVSEGRCHVGDLTRI